MKGRFFAVSLFGVFCAAFALSVAAGLLAPAAQDQWSLRKILREPEEAFLRQSRLTLAFAQAWLFTNVRPNGLFLYSYDPATGVAPKQNNELRQLLASRILAEECAQSGNAAICEKHQRNLSFILKHWYREGSEGGYIYFDQKSKLGATATLLRVLVASPDFSEHGAKARALLENIRFLQNPDGSFRVWYIEPGYAFNAEHLETFYSGETLVALVEYYGKTRDPEALASLDRALEHYLEYYVEKIDENYYSSYVPWLTQALAKYYAFSPEPRYAEAAFVMNDRLLAMQDRSVFLGRFFNPETPQYGDPHSSSDAVDTEGLAYALELAERTGDAARAMRYREAVRLAVFNLASLQYRSWDPAGSGLSKRYVGALRTEENKTWVRLDTASHTIDALKKILALW